MAAKFPQKIRKLKLIDHLIHGTRLARFWGYLGDASNPYAVYDFTEDRTRTGPRKFLESFRGYLQADAYAGYDGIYKRSKKPPPNKSSKNEPDINTDGSSLTAERPIASANNPNRSSPVAYVSNDRTTERKHL